MNPLTTEWVSKAEGDFRTALRELSVEDDPNYDAVCFHAQQCIEKYLKARLQEADIPILRTHDLSVLLSQLTPIEIAWEVMRPSLRALNLYAVRVRYPGESPLKDDAHQAVIICQEMRRIIRMSLGLIA